MRERTPLSRKIITADKFASAMIAMVVCFVLVSQIALAKNFNIKPLPKDFGFDGVSLSFYLDQQISESLVTLTREQRDLFTNQVFFINGAEHVSPAEFNCKALIWRPLKGSEKHKYNRIQCETYYSSNKKPIRVLILLSEDEIADLKGLNTDPSFSFSGPFSGSLIETLRTLKNSSNLNKHNVHEFKAQNKNSYFLLTGSEPKTPYLQCSSNMQNPSCQFIWPNLNSHSVKVSLGDFGLALAEATCSKLDHLTINGSCPQKWEEASKFECFYIGQWVSHGDWGSIDNNAKITCEYNLNQNLTSFDILLGPIVVHPWGSRFGKPSISIEGIGLKPIYDVLKAHAQKNKEPNASAIGYTEFGGGEWGMQWVSLRRYSYPSDNLLSSFECQFNDVSHNVFKQVPNKNFFFETNRYTCAIHTDFKR